MSGQGARSLATYLAARLVPAACSMALTLLCIDRLEAAAYARYSLALLAAGMVVAVAGGVSAHAMLRHGRGLSPAALRQAIFELPLVISALAAPLVVFWLWRTIGWSVLLLLAALLVPATALVDTRRSLQVARGDAGAVFRLDTLRAVAALTLGALLLWAWPGASAAPLLAQLLALALAITVVRVPQADPQATGRVDRRYLGHGLGLALWMAGIVGLSLAERAVVAQAGGLADSGRYAAQADLVNALFSTAGGALGAALMPAYLTLGSVPDARASRRLLVLGLSGAACVGAVAVAAGAAIGGLALGRIGAAVSADGRTGVALVAAAAVWMAAGFVQKPLELRGQSRWMVGAIVAALVAFAALAPVLRQALGPLGVALAKLSAGLVFCAVTVAAVRWVR